MKIAKIVNAVVLALLLLFVAKPAAADGAPGTDVWSFTFDSLGVSLVGLITTTNTLNSLGNFDVTGITGTFNGAPIGTLLFNPNQPFVFDAPDGNLWDNNLIPGAPFVTTNGIGFNFEGDQLVLFSGVTGDPLSEGLFFQNLQESAIGTLTIEQTPEPVTWGLLLCGLLGLGALRLASGRKRGAALVI
jgi:hypothetical protein